MAESASSRPVRRRVVAALVFGLAGIAILLALGTWQLRRLEWKESLIAELETRLAADPVPLPAAPTEAQDEYLRVSLAGRFTGEEADVLSSLAPWGPGFRIVSAFETEDGRRILVDRGFVPEARKNDPRPPRDARFTATLLWPNETDGFTPDPDLAKNFWFARDAARMAEALGTEPLMAVADAAPEGDEWPKPQPVTVNLPNDHLEYAITWFSLAVVWAGMTAGLVLRILRRGAI